MFLLFMGINSLDVYAAKGELSKGLEDKAEESIIKESIIVEDKQGESRAVYYNDILPTTDLIGASYNVNTNVQLTFDLYSFGTSGYGVYYYVSIYDLKGNKLVGTSGTFSSAIGKKRLNLSWNTSDYTPGKYYIVAETAYKEHEFPVYLNGQLSDGELSFDEGDMYTYTGYEITPSFTYTYDSKSFSSSDFIASDAYSVEYSNNINAGTATVTLTGLESAYYTGSISKTFIINPQTYTVVFKDNQKVIKTQVVESGKSATAPKINKSGYRLQWSTNFNNVSSNITVNAKWIPNVYKVNFNGNGANIAKKSMNLAYNSSYGKLEIPKRAGYTFSGWYTAKSNGTKITSSSKLKIASNVTLYAHWTKVTVKKATISSLKNSASKEMNVKYKAVSGAQGYIITYATNNNFSKEKKTITVSSKTLSVKIRKLKKNKTYYVKVQAYKQDSAGKKVIGKCTKSYKVVIKK